MDRIALGHGGGGRLMHELIKGHFAPAFDIKEFLDSAILDIRGNNPNSKDAVHPSLAFTTDSYVVSPIFFPGANIGELAVYGTVNDLVMVGATPLYLTAGFILEEGFLFKDLKAVVLAMSQAAKKAGVKIVAGDTKVVNKGKGDGIFINTAGVGAMIDGVELSAGRIKQGDAVICSGEIGNHGVAVISERNGITFQPPVLSDTAPLNGLVKLMIDVTRDIHFMRDPTRGGLATTLKEAADESGRCIRVKETSIPIAPRVRGACDLLGLDPLYVANEGILVAIVGQGAAEPLIEAMKGHPYGVNARIIGEVEESPEGMVLLETPIGGTRILDMQLGEHLPRIC